ncbi:type II secretion system minor pseudopilin GspJ [Congregibacter litoralis]|uniref:Type II secretion system protein J n=1 Tax=Congregibacter litoralis KT71 TaxID=314285 RepID=A4A5K3_9GAMM|nr:type II secretion system minor pseudopilin GspJ [Congregibacter litoralis]EAQ99074.1 type II secretion system protein J (GspJ) [Congregibacter litoralis KT71]
MTDPGQRGFTLVEVLIALAITAFVAAASYSGISSTLTGAEQLRTASERTRDLNRALAFLNRDLRQFSNRPVRDEFGGMQPALSGGPLAFYPLSLTRDGWSNTLQQPRSELQRVFYYLEEDSLWRAYYPVLDRAVDAEPQRMELLQQVTALELRFLDTLDNLQLDRDLVVDTRGWRESWVADPGAGNAVPPPPVALELRIELADLGEVRRLYELPLR